VSHSLALKFDKMVFYLSYAHIPADKIKNALVVNERILAVGFGSSTTESVNQAAGIVLQQLVEIERLVYLLLCDSLTKIITSGIFICRSMPSDVSLVDVYSGKAPIPQQFLDYVANSPPLHKNPKKAKLISLPSTSSAALTAEKTVESTAAIVTGADSSVI
jgi:hypothetical protein